MDFLNKIKKIFIITSMIFTAFFVSVFPISAESEIVDYPYCVSYFVKNDWMLDNENREIKYRNTIYSTEPLILISPTNFRFESSGKSKVIIDIVFKDDGIPPMHSNTVVYDEPLTFPYPNSDKKLYNLKSNYTIKYSDGTDFFTAPLLTEQTFAPIQEMVQKGMMVTVGLMIFLMGLGVCLALLLRRFKRFSTS